VDHASKNFFLKKRRGISNIIGSLIVLALVASVGSVILFQGLNQINTFNYDLTNYGQDRVNEIREDIIFEHVRFDSSGSLPEGDDLQLFLANIGSVDSQISSITVVNINSQELLFNRESPPNVSEAYIPIEDHTVITLDSGANFIPPADTWDDANYGPGNLYKITVGTSKGNFFSTVVEPFN